MSGPQRYGQCTNLGGDYWLEENDEGDFVRFSDYEALEKRLRAENERLTIEAKANDNLAVANGHRAKEEYERAEAATARALAAEARAEKAEEALRAIAEGNLGDGPGQANYARIKQVALASLPKESADA